ncbi:MAG: RNA-directed DNA polymerase [Bacteroidales bacterium]|nr:RNA-directed DNA polymerase [Bacteroidales bacterium]
MYGEVMQAKPLRDWPYAFSYGEVEKAFKDCIKNKKNTANAMKYSEYSVRNIMDLCDEINSMTYEIGPSITFIVKFPVYREVFAADFRDRVIHHLIMNELLPLFEETFIDDTYSCRKRRGVLYGVTMVDRQIRECTDNYKKDAWVYKLDLKSFFMSIVKSILAENLDDFIRAKYTNPRKKERLRVLCRQVVMHRPELLCERRGDKNAWKNLEKGKSLFEKDGDTGIPIGNLTSQIFANFYLHPLDIFIRETLGFRYYGRYVDDFVIISDDKEKLKKAIPEICKFCEETLKVRVHPRKRYMQHHTKGTPFTGAIIKKDRTYIINRTKGTLYYKIKKQFATYSEERLDKFLSVVNSYLGFMVHHDTYNIRKAILTDESIMKPWLPYIKIDKSFSKITRKNKINQRAHIFDSLIEVLQRSPLD